MAYASALVTGLAVTVDLHRFKHSGEQAVFVRARATPTSEEFSLSLNLDEARKLANDILSELARAGERVL